MNPTELRDLVAAYSVSAIECADTRAGCRIELPIAEPGGDSIGVIVKKLDGGGYRIHDGGHIGGLLFQAGPQGAEPSAVRAVRELLRAADLSEDPESGIAFADADARAVPYWAYEIGRVIAVAASIAPSPALAQSAADGESRSSNDRRTMKALRPKRGGRRKPFAQRTARRRHLGERRGKSPRRRQ